MTSFAQLNPINYGINSAVAQPNPLGAISDAYKVAGQRDAFLGKRQDAINADYALQQAMERKKQFNLALSDYMQSPSPDKAANLNIQFPELAAEVKTGIAQKSDIEKQQSLSLTSNVYNALRNKDYGTADALLAEQEEAYRNSGREQEAKLVAHKRNMLQKNPNELLSIAELTLSQLDENFAENTKKFAEIKRAEDLHPLEKDKLSADIELKKEDRKLKIMEAQLAKATTPLKQQELQAKINAQRAKLEQATQDKKEKLEQADKDKKAAFTSAVTKIDTQLNTISQALEFPLKVWEDVSGPVGSRLPTFTHDSANLEASINTIKSQNFINGVTELKQSAGGIGPITDKDAEFIINAAGSLDLKQSPEKSIRTLREIHDRLLKYKQVLSEKYGIELPEAPSGATDNIDLNLNADEKAVWDKY